MADQVPRIKEGPRIYIESVLTGKEYRECAHKYPNTYQSAVPASYFPSEYPWRYKMGTQMTPEDIKQANDKLAELYKILKEYHDKEGIS